jgi:hypothetical protein
MVFSYYLYKLPYTLCWLARKLIHKLNGTVFYCGEPLDHYIFAPVNKHLKNVTYVTDKPEVKSFLHKQGIPYLSMPVYPQAVIMARHSTYKFPSKYIKKIGLRHGAYHFKRMTSALNYNQFDLYLMTSLADVQAGTKLGITCAQAVGFPKLDPAFDGTYDADYLTALKCNIALDIIKPTLLFTSTYDASGMSGISQWFNRLLGFTSKYNVLVTLHPWVHEKYRDVVENTPGVHQIKDYNIVPYIMLADAVIGDNSSILAECCALDKPMITFTTPKAKRSLDEIENLLNKISIRITSFSELTENIEKMLRHPSELHAERTEANRLMFDTLDGKAGERAANQIKQLLIASETL